MTRSVAVRPPWIAIGSLGLVTIAGYGACYYAYGALIEPIAFDTGWSRATLGACFSAVLFAAGLGGPLAGRLLDRHGAQVPLLAGAVAGTGGLLAASFQTSFALFAVSYAGGCGLVGALSFYHVTQPAAARLTPTAPARAIIALTIAGAFASPVYLPLTGYLADTIGWRATLRAQAATIAVIFVIAAALTGGAGPAEQTGEQRITTVLATAWKSRAVRGWLIATLIGGAASDVMLVYQVPAMIAAGLPVTTAATVAGLRGMAQLSGRLPLGAVLRRLGAKATIVAASLIGAVAAVALLASGRLPLALTYSLLAGASLGAISTLQGIYTRELVDPRHLGMLFGAQQAAFGIGGALGPALGGGLLALTGSYDPIIIIVAVAFAASGALLLLPAATPRVAPEGADQRSEVAEEHGSAGP